MEKIAIKLGGSIITDKGSEIPKARVDVINRLVKEIYESGKIPFFIANGAGSFGHQLAKEYFEGKLKNPVDIHESVVSLHEIVVEKAEKNNLKMESVSPLETCKETKKGIELSKFFAKAEKILEGKKIVASYGDMIPSYDNRYKVLSADVLTVKMAKRFGADKIIMVAYVDGVLDESGRVVEELSITDKIPKYYGNGGADVTGGFEEKIRLLQEAAGDGIDCYIIGGMIKNNLKNYLLGKESVGTSIFGK